MMDDTPLLRHLYGCDKPIPRYYHRHRVGISGLEATTTRGRERVFLLDQFLDIDFQAREAARFGFGCGGGGATVSMSPCEPRRDALLLKNDENRPPSEGLIGPSRPRSQPRSIQPQVPSWAVQTDFSADIAATAKTSYTNFPHFPEWPNRTDFTFQTAPGPPRRPSPMALDPALSRLDHLGHPGHSNHQDRPNQQLQEASRYRESFQTSTAEFGHPGLLDCPPRVFHAVCDVLPWSAKEQLSRTCTTFWHRLHPICRAAAQAMSRPQLLQHLAELAQTMPLHAVCGHCARLHRITAGDVPALHLRSAQARLCQQFLYHRRYIPDFGFGYGYHLERHHVQLALKLARLGRLPGYVDAIMAPYHIRSHNHATRALVQLFVRPVMTLHEHPPSFLVFRALEFAEYLEAGALPLDATSVQHLVLCPHASLTDSDPEDMRCDVLYQAVRSARAGLFTHRDFACRRCPTDMSIHTQPGRLYVRTWHDLGPEGRTPDDDGWTVHIGSADNNEFTGPAVPHLKGSVRARYEYAVRIQPPSKAVTACDDTIFRITTSGLHDAGRSNVADRQQGRWKLDQRLDGKMEQGLTGSERA